MVQANFCFLSVSFSFSGKRKLIPCSSRSGIGNLIFYNYVNIVSKWCALWYLCSMDVI